MIETSDTINELAADLALAQGEIEGAKKDSDNPFFRSKYADLASVWAACRGPLTSHGLSVVQFPNTDYQGEAEGYEWVAKSGETRYGVRVNCVVSVRSRLLHKSGQWMEGSVSTMLPTGDPQAVGSAVSYLRRYALQSIVGIAPEDDDGEGAMTKGMEKPAGAIPTKPVATNGPVQVNRVTPKPTRNENVTRYEVVFTNGLKAATINAKLANAAIQARDSGQHVRPVTVQGKYGIDLQSLGLENTAPMLDETPLEEPPL